jgi:hypothetical protein
MNDQPRDPKQVPEGAEPPTVEQPTAAAADAQPPTQHPAATGAGEPAATAGQPQAEQPTVAAPAQGQPAAAAPSTGEPAAQPLADPAAGQTAAHGQLPPPVPPTPQLSQPGPGQAYGAWGPPQAAQRPSGGFRRFVGHRATQLVAVGVLGLLVGGGIVGGIAAATNHGPRDGRPGIHRQYNGPNGGPGSDGRGPGFPGRGGGNSGNSGDSGATGSGDGI